MAKFRAYIDLKALVVKENDKSTPKSNIPGNRTRRGTEEREEQWYQKHHCRPIDMEYGEWQWRWEAAIAILCGGNASAYGTYYGEIIGEEELE